MLLPPRLNRAIMISSVAGTLDLSESAARKSPTGRGLRGRDVAVQRSPAALRHVGPRLGVEVPASPSRTSHRVPMRRCWPGPGSHPACQWVRPCAGPVCLRARWCVRHVALSAPPGPPPAALVQSLPTTLSPGPAGPVAQLSDVLASLADQACRLGLGTTSGGGPWIGGVEGTPVPKARSRLQAVDARESAPASGPGLPSGTRPEGPTPGPGSRPPLLTGLPSASGCFRPGLSADLRCFLKGVQLEAEARQSSTAMH